MTSLPILVSIIVPVAVFTIGLHVLGYPHLLRLCLHLIALGLISRAIIGLYNTLLFRLSLNRASDYLAHLYVAKRLPPPKKYGYFDGDDFKLRKWSGQTYLEDIIDDSEVDEVTRLEAKILVHEIHEAEKSHPIREGRLMKLAVKAMSKYHNVLKKGDTDAASYGG